MTARTRQSSGDSRRPLAGRVVNLLFQRRNCRTGFRRQKNSDHFAVRHRNNRRAVPAGNVGCFERHNPICSVRSDLIAIAKSVEGWEPDGKSASFRRWLGCVARNVAIKFMMRERKQITGQGGSDFLTVLEEAIDSSVNGELQHQYQQELILWAAERVRSEFRESSWRAFWETEVAGRSIAEVSKDLGVSVGSAYMSRSRIFARIRVIIEEVLDED